ncbi:hypothetical protein BA6E_125593 [Bacteroidales bacterium 6E]|nr:hypothetical protein BA6E_125593 [Bacteroidales bacterium 6E]
MNTTNIYNQINGGRYLDCRWIKSLPDIPIRNVAYAARMVFLMVLIIFVANSELFGQSFSATLSSNQLFKRPSPGTSNCGGTYGTFTSVSSNASTDYAYATQSFTISAAGNYTITVTASTAGDPMLLVYGSFNPSSPTSGFIVGDDDSNGSLLPKIGSCNNYFSSGTYTLVVTSYSAATRAGTVNFNISGAGTATILPTVSTNTASSVTSTSVILGGNVSADGGATVSARGVAWGTSSNPTSGTPMGSGTGSFSQTINGLTPGTTYYARAYATNSVGTAYGPQISFTTQNYTPPSVTTNSVTNIGLTAATFNGNVTNTGGQSVSRGFQYSTNSSFSGAITRTISGTQGTGSFSYNETSLTGSTLYYVRAWASNNGGTTYGSATSFYTDHTVTYTSGANGTLSGSTSQTVDHGGSGSPVTAVPNAGYHFVRWSDFSTSNPRTDVNVTSSFTRTATFAINNFRFAVQPGNRVAGVQNSFTVEAIDNLGNRVTNSDRAISIDVKKADGTTIETLSANLSSGFATVSGPSITQTGNYYLFVSDAGGGVNGTFNSLQSSTFTVTPAAIHHFTVSGITDPHKAGETTSPTVTAYDMYGNMKYDYTGTISFHTDNVSAKPDKPTVLPVNYSFTGTDQGTKTFTNGANLKQYGENFFVQVKDTEVTEASGRQEGISVTSAELNYYAIAANPDESGNQQDVKAGNAFSVLAELYDEFGNKKVDYTGDLDVSFTSDASPSPLGNVIVIPAPGDRTFTNGVATIPGFILYNAQETPVITITETLTGSSGTTELMTVWPEMLDNFLVQEAPAQNHGIGGVRVTAGVPFSVKVTARDPYNNIKRDYAGYINFKSSNDAIVQYPTGLQQFTVGEGASFNNGIRIFENVLTIPTIGSYWIRVADSPQAFKTGTLEDIVVGPGIQSQVVSELAFTEHPGITTYPSESVKAGDFVSVTITPRDANDNLLCDCQSVQVFLNGVDKHRTGTPENGVPALSLIEVTDNHDGTYTAMVRVSDMSQTNEITASVNGTTLNTILQVAVNEPDAPSLVVSTITPEASSITTDENTLVTIQLKDQFGNNRLTNDGTIYISTTEGGFGANNGIANGYEATYNDNGSYTATLYASHDAITHGVGTATLSVIADFTDDLFADGALAPVSIPTVIITEGLPSLITSTIAADPVEITTDEFSTVTVQLKDHLGNLILHDRGSIDLETDVLGEITDAVYDENGKYVAYLWGDIRPVNGTGISVISGSFAGAGSASAVNGYFNDGGSPAEKTTASVTITEGLPALDEIQITANPAVITTDESSIITVTLYDHLGNLIINGRGTVSLSTNLGVLSTVTDNGDGTYTAILTADASGTGTATITGTILIDNAGQPVVIEDNATVLINEGLPSLSMSSVASNPATMTTDGSSTITLQLKDQWGNDLTTGRGVVTMESTIGLLSGVTDHGDGTYTATLTGDTRGINGTGTSVIDASFEGDASASSVNGDFTNETYVVISEGLPALSQIDIAVSDTEITADETSSITVQLKDQWGNLLTTSRGTITLSVSPIGVISTVTDNNDGTYSATFSLNDSGTGIATITGTISGEADGEILDNATVEVSHGIATNLRIDTQPSDYVRAGDVLAIQPVVSIRDALGNIVTSDNSTTVTASRKAGTSTETLKGTVAMTVEAGVVTFTDLRYELMETITLDFVANPALSTVTSNNVLVDHNATVRYEFSSVPAYIIAGGQRGAYVVTRYDAYDNLVNNSVGENGEDLITDETVYLYTSAADNDSEPNVTSKFHSAATGGTIVTSIGIANGATSKGFWYYSTVAGQHTISASDKTPLDVTDENIINAEHLLEVRPAALSHFVVSGVGTDAGGGWTEHYYGDVQSVTVEAIDILGNRKTNYNGSITFNLTDGQAVVNSNFPRDYTFTVGTDSDNGIHTFENAILFTRPSFEHPSYPTVNEWWVTVIDKAQPSKYGSQVKIKVLPRPLLVSIAETPTKVYDANTGITLTASFTVDNLVTGETITAFNAEANYDTKDVGEEKVITAIMDNNWLTTTDYVAGANTILKYYTLPSNVTGTGSITPKDVLVEITGNPTKTYDGNTIATLQTSDYTVTTGIPGETFEVVNQTNATYDEKNQGTRTVSVVFNTFPGTANYFNKDNWSAAATRGSASISYQTVAGENRLRMAYNGNGSYRNGTYTYTITANRTETVTFDWKLTGCHSYYQSVATFKLWVGNTGNIIQTLYSGGGCSFSRTGTSSFEIASGTKWGIIIYGDHWDSMNQINGYLDVVLPSFNPGENTLAGNYTFPATATGAGLILRKEITGTIVASDKDYDGNTIATITQRTLTGVIAADADKVALTGDAATFAGKDVGEHTVTSSGMTITGDEADNYSLTDVATTTASILPKALAITEPSIADRVYDGTTTPGALTIGTLSGFVDGETVTASGLADDYPGKDAGQYIVDIAYSLQNGTGGGLATNYSLATGTATGTVTQRPITANSSVASKVYDGQPTTGTVVLGELDNLVGDETLVITTTTTPYADKHVGTGKATTISYTLLDGTDGNGGIAANYTMADKEVTGEITVRAINATAQADTKVYDGSPSSVVSPVVDDLQTGDILVNAGSQTFDNKDQGTGKTLTPSGASINDGNNGNNYAITYVPNTSGEISKRLLAVSVTGDPEKVYDGDTEASLVAADYTITNVVDGESVSISETAGTYNSKNVGTSPDRTVTVTLADDDYVAGNAGTTLANYTLPETATGAGTITVRSLTLDNFVANDKTYDGTTSVTGDGFSDNRISGDVLTFSYGVAFEDKNVGTGKDVNFTSIAISGGADQSNYTLVTSSGVATADISARDLTLDNFVADDKTYDGTTNVTGDAFSDDRVSGDDLTFSYNVAFEDKNVGTGKDVNFTSIAISGGADQDNYTLLTTTGVATADISVRDLTLDNFVANDKTYDGTTSVTGDAFSDDRVSGDVLTFSYNVAFEDKNVGADKDVNFTNIAISGGADKDNYSLLTTAGTVEADITARTLNLSNFAADNKVYDGTTVATGLGFDDNRIPGDNLSFQRTAEFETPSVGYNKVVVYESVSITGGTDKDNYRLETDQSHWKTAPNRIISQAPVTVSIMASDKPYDGNTMATVSLSGNFVTGDEVSLTYTSATFDDESVGLGKTVTISGIALTGTNAGQYTLASTTATTTASITPVARTVAVTGVSDYIYSGLPQGPATATVSAGDGSVSYSYSGTGSTTYATSSTAPTNAGTYHVVATVVENGNYAGATSEPYSFTINKKELTVIDVVAQDKVYDKTTHASVSVGSLSGVVGSDDVSVTASANFDNAQVGNNKTITVSYSLQGTKAANYMAPAGGVLTSAGEITQRPLTITGSFDAIDRVYDRSNAASITNVLLQLVSVIPGDDVTLKAIASFADKLVGNSKPVALTSSILEGADSGNYMLTFTSAPTTSADITPKALTVTGAMAQDKTYDGNTEANIAVSSLNGVIAGDVVTLDALVGTFAQSDAGNGIPVTPALTLKGTDAANYALTQPSGLTASVLKRELTVTGAEAVDKTYDATTDIVILDAVLQGKVSSDDVTLGSLGGRVANKNVGTDKPVTATLTLTGAKVSNYTLVQPVGLTVTISPKSVSVTGAVAMDKTFDGTTDAVISGAILDGIIAGDVVSLMNGTSGTFAQSEVGSEVEVTTAMYLAGTDAGNYLLIQPQGLKADIMPGIQQISLTAGWNIISIGMSPTGSTRLIDILRPLIDAGTLIKVIDDKGNTIENLGSDEWFESIGDLLATEGYQVKVSENTSLEVNGTPVQLPIDIPLVKGWNIISFPSQVAQNAMDVFDQLIKGGYLLKAMDEKGRPVEELAGDWYNFIGNLEPGEGYKVKVSSACTLTIRESYTKSLINVPDLLSSDHFMPVYSGNGYDHMNLLIRDLEASGLKEGDELGIFDGDLCVGSVRIDHHSMWDNLISIPVSASDGLSEFANGFTEGNRFAIRIFRDGNERYLTFEVESGSTPVFTKGATSALKVTYTSVAVGVNPARVLSMTYYPNPFRDRLNIELETIPGTRISVGIVDVLGRKLSEFNIDKTTGHDVVQWQGTDAQGVPVPAGTYIILINGQHGGTIIRQ